MKSFKEHLQEERANTICVDVPLFIRLLEYAREDAKDDLDLHYVAEKAIAAHISGVSTLGMSNYNSLIKK